MATGAGTATGQPDRCALHAGLNVMAGTVGEAVDRRAALAGRAVAALHGRGIEAPDVRTTAISVRDLFDQAEKRVTARIASYQLQVTIRDLGAVGDVLGALSDEAGDSLQVHGLRLAVGDPTALAGEARRRAVLDARRAASELADAAGVRLGALLSIDGGPTPAGGPGTVPGLRTRPLSAGGAAGGRVMPVEPGEVAVASTVTLTYAIEP